MPTGVMRAVSTLIVVDAGLAEDHAVSFAALKSACF
jgi:hypothetical protein